MMRNEDFPMQLYTMVEWLTLVIVSHSPWLSNSVKQEQLLAKQNKSLIDVPDDVKEGIDLHTLSSFCITLKFCIRLLTYLF